MTPAKQTWARKVGTSYRRVNAACVLSALTLDNAQMPSLVSTRMMSVPKISKWPFLVGDLLIIACAACIALYGGSLGQWQFAAMVGAVAFGAWLAVWPFVLEFRAATKLLETSALSDV